VIRSVVVLVTLTAAAHAAPAMVDDPAHEPYYAVLGPRGGVERADELARLGRESTDPGRAARYFALACHARSFAVVDTMNRSPECKRAAALAARHGLADVDTHLAYVRGHLLAWTVDIAGAVSALRHAIELGKTLDVESERGFPVRAARFTLAAIVLEAGQYDVAIAGLGEVRRAAVAARDEEFTAWTDLWQCRAYRRIGELATARTHCDAARPYAERVDDWNLRMNLGWIEGELEADLGRHDVALARFLEGWDLASRAPGVELFYATLLLSVCDQLLALGRHDEANAWFARLEALPQPATYLPQLAMYRGRIARARDELAAASAAFEAATASRLHPVAIQARYELAATRKALGDIAGARAALEDAIARIETDRAAVGPDQRATFMALHALAYRALIGLVWDEAGPAAASRALDVAEAGRARSLLDAVTMSGAETAAATPLPAAAIVASLAADELVIDYAVAIDRAFAVAATRAGVVIVPLPDAGGEAALAQRVSFFRQLVAEATTDAEIALPARRLHADLIAPVLAALPDRGRDIATLIVSPDGPLHALPWDALAAGDGAFVVDRYRVVVVPSASVIGRRPAAPAAGALVVAMPDAVGGLPPLGRAPAETAAIRRRIGGEVTALVGAASTETAIAGAARGAAVIHFASHAVVDRVMPLRSALVVAADATGDGRWRADEIYRQELAADLVVLAACETGVGTATGGEGVMSLARAFLHAGAGATIATLWPVADDVGPAFADALYRSLANRDSIAGAATTAKRALRASGARPADWAAYVVTAAPRATARVDPGDRSSPAPAVPARWPWIAAIAAVGALAVIAARRRALVAAVAGAAAVAGVVAIVVVVRPAQAPKLTVTRGAAAPAVAAQVEGDRVAWTVEPGVTYRVTFFTADGRALAVPSLTPGTATVPPGAAWSIVEAERDGVAIARPAMISLAR
jgi:CHAT domain-containing protein